MEYLYGQKVINNQRGNFELANLLKENNWKKIMIVSGSTFEKTYLNEWFERLPQTFIQFKGFSSNPKYEEVCEGVQLFLKEKCDCILAVGGGSAIDTAKCIKLFAKLDQNKDYLNQAFVDSDIPFIAIPTTAGSGSEANRNAVIYKDGNKVSIFHETCRPDYLYFEPIFLQTLPDYVKKSTLADAICQCIESIWAKTSTEESIQIASEGLKLLLDNAMVYLRGEERVLDAIQKGAYLSGKAIDLTKTTAAHALSYKLASTCHINHGHAVMMLLPSVCLHLTSKLESYGIETLVDERNDLPEEIQSLMKKMNVIKNIVLPGEISYLALYKQLSFILRILGLSIPSFIGEEGIWDLVKNVNIERLNNHPLALTEQEIYCVYLDAFKMMKDENGEIVVQPEYKEVVDRQEFVSGLQQLTLETLLLTKKFLDEHGLTFYLGEGTLLGCIRHQGFIPWDDDVDICMPRDDYQKLVELAKQGKVPAELNFDSLENNDKHWVLGAKMQLVRETDYIQEKVIPLSKCHGPYVDIFPLDYWPKPYSFKQRLCDLKVKVSRRMLFMKTGYSIATKKKFHRFVLRFICLFVSNKQIEKMAIRNMRKYQDKKRRYLVNLCSYYPFYKEVFPISCFSIPQMKMFEGHEMPVPKEYDYVCKTIYGAKYDTIPPFAVTAMRKHAFARKSDLNKD